MKYFKRQPINKQNPISNSFAVEIDGRIVTQSNKSLEIPDGGTADRPDDPVNGMLRYNTDIDAFEAYIDGIWQLLIANTQATVTQQIFENGDYADTIFGPLAYDISISRPENILVYVENVPQIANINYGLVFGSEATPYTTSTNTSQLIPISTNTIYLESVADFNQGLAVSGSGIPVGSTIVESNSTGSFIVINNQTTSPISSGTEVTVFYTSGTYVKFTNNSIPVPFKPVIVLLGFDGYNPPIVP